MSLTRFNYEAEYVGYQEPVKTEGCWDDHPGRDASADAYLGPFSRCSRGLCEWAVISLRSSNVFKKLAGDNRICMCDALQYQTLRILSFVCKLDE